MNRREWTHTLIALDAGVKMVTARYGMEPIKCDGCTKCCKGFKIYLTDLDDPEQYLHDGKALLQKPNGECVYLVDGGCGIYEDRPHACRDFDCRAFVTLSTHTQLRKLDVALQPVIREGRKRFKQDRRR